MFVFSSTTPQNVDAAGQADLLTYNTIGDLSQKRDLKQQSFGFAYDNLHRLVTSNVGTASFKTYYEDNPFGPIRKEEWSGSTLLKSAAYAYTADGQLKVKSVTSEGHALSLTNTFDLAGKVTGVTNGYGFTTAYHYDKVRVEKVQTNGSSANPGGDDSQYARYEYNPNGTLKTVTYPRLGDGTYAKADYVYDKINRLTSITNSKGGQTLSSYGYGYDANGNITSVTDAAGTTTYSYDPLNRLTQTSRPDGQIVTYTYDGRGNRKTSQGDSLILSEASYS
ncbi:RHS repeat protein, partial [Paenibacillus hemerocallicola]